MANEQAKQLLSQATAAIQNGDFNGALGFINQAIEIDPSDAEAFVLRGIAMAQTGQPEGATEAFHEALRIDPNNVKAHYNLAVHYYGSGDKSAALEMVRQALAFDPNHAAARDLLRRLESEGMAGPAADPTATPPYAGESPGAYGAPPQPGYYREGYDQYQSPVHSIAMVERMGKKWDFAGWGIVIGGVVILAGNIAFGTGTRAIRDLINDTQGTLQRMRENPHLYDASALGNLFTILSWLVAAIALTYMIMDIIDRRGNWLWMIPFVCCCCCGFHWAALGIYLAAGRK